ncbi:MAG TPA: 6-bladed beta-propeller [Nitrospirae bacterium]|nr:6-bladed beta-propeller [Nitrospirota bacterium]
MKRTFKGNFHAWLLVLFVPLVLFLAAGLQSCRSDDSMTGEGGIGDKPISIRSPVRIDFTSDGNLLVSDYFRKRIYIIDSSDLKMISSFPVAGRPLAVAFLDSLFFDIVFVGNESTGTVEAYTLQGWWLYDLGGTKGNVKKPNDIAIDKTQDMVFVVDSNDGLIKVFRTDGQFLYSIGGTGADPELLVSPRGIAVDENAQEIFVTDFGNPSDSAEIPARLKIYNYAGNYLGGFSAEDVASGYEFASPQGIAVSDNYIFMVESVLGKILVFNRGTFAGVKTIGSFGSNPGQLFLPLDIIIDPATEDVFVTNNRPRRIEAYPGGGVIP